MIDVIDSLHLGVVLRRHHVNERGLGEARSWAMGGAMGPDMAKVYASRPWICSDNFMI